MEKIQRYKNSLMNKKGFTLVEIGIVLVIIGIILGAALKGKDLIYGARYKKFINYCANNWTIAAYGYLDRFGRFPGDINNNGLIGSGYLATKNVASDITAANLVDSPTSPVTIGSFTFYVFLGNDAATAGVPPGQNILAVCVDAACATTFDSEQIKFVQAFKTSVDGIATGVTGLVRCTATAPATPPTAGKNTVQNYGPITSADCVTAGTTAVAMIYYFDRPQFPVQ